MTLLFAAVLPLAAAVLAAVLPRRLTALVAVTGAFASLGASLAIAQAVSGERTSLTAEIAAWLPVRGADLGLTMDTASAPLAVALAGAVALVAAAAALGPARPTAAFVSVGLVGSGTLLVVTAANLVLCVAGLQLAALGASLLAAPERERPATDASWGRAMVAGRAADVLMLLGVVGFVSAFATADLAEIARRFAPPLPPDARERLAAAALVPSALLVAGSLARPALVALRRAGDDRPQAALAHGVAALAGVLLVLRLAPILHPGVTAAVAAAGATAAVVAGLAAVLTRRLPALLAATTLVDLGLLAVAVAAASPFAVVLRVLAHAYGWIAFVLATVAARDPRRMFAAAIAAATVAPLPPAAGFFAAWATLAAVGDRPWLFAPAAIATALGAFASGRALRVAFSSAPDERAAARANVLAAAGLGSALVTAALGVAAATGMVALGHPLPEWPVPVAAAVAALCGAGLTAGFALSPRLPDVVWQPRDGASVVDRVLGAIERGSEAAVEAAVRAVTAAVEAFGGVARRSETGLVRVQTAVLLATAVGLLAFWSLR